MEVRRMRNENQRTFCRARLTLRGAGVKLLVDILTKKHTTIYKLTTLEFKTISYDVKYRQFDYICTLTSTIYANSSKHKET